MNNLKRGKLASVLQKMRRENNMTQQDLAKKLGVSRSVVANWEAGIRQPGKKYAEDLSRIFGVSTDYLFGGSDVRYNINTGDYFELDLTKLNRKGALMLKDFYELLLNSGKYRC